MKGNIVYILAYVVENLDFNQQSKKSKHAAKIVEIYQDKNVNIFMATCQFFRLNHRCIFCCKAVLHVIYYTTEPKMVSYCNPLQ